jgi:hypothetical protein
MLKAQHSLDSTLCRLIVHRIRVLQTGEGKGMGNWEGERGKIAHPESAPIPARTQTSLSPGMALSHVRNDLACQPRTAIDDSVHSMLRSIRLSQVKLSSRNGVPSYRRLMAASSAWSFA